MEIWADIKGYEGLYQISNLGRVKNLYKKPPIIMKQSITSDGYYRIKLRKGRNENNYRIHRLVAEAFIPNPDNLPIINHKDEDKSNNRMNNLEWCDNTYNINYSINSRKKTHIKKQVRCIETGIVYDNLHQAAKAIGMGSAAACHIKEVCLGRRHLVGNYHWEYADTPSWKSKVNYDNLQYHRSGTKSVKCIETGKIYKSISEASRELDISWSTVRKLCEGESVKSTNYHLEYEK